MKSLEVLGNIVLYLMGWSLFVALQAQNSIRSKSNGLTDNFDGWRTWLRFHLLDLMLRGFVCGLIYRVAVYTTAAKLQALGVQGMTTFTVAGMAGWTANGLVYQILGVLGYRVEIGEKVPPKRR
jgi:hypothetical protein